MRKSLKLFTIFSQQENNSFILSKLNLDSVQLVNLEAKGTCWQRVIGYSKLSMLIADPSLPAKGTRTSSGARSSQPKTVNSKSGHPPRPASSQATTKPPLRSRQPGHGATGDKKHSQQKRKTFNGSATMIGQVSLHKSGAAGPLIDKQLLMLMKQEQGGKSDPQPPTGAFQSQKEKRSHLAALAAGALPSENNAGASLKLQPQSSRSLSNLQKSALADPLANPERPADFDKQQAFAYNPQGELQPGQARWGKKSANLPRQAPQKDAQTLLARATPQPKQVSSRALQPASKTKREHNDSDIRSIHVKSSIGLSDVHASLAALAVNKASADPSLQPLTQLSQKQSVNAKADQACADLKLLSAYGQKRQSARNYKEKARVQIVGRRVDAPHIIVPQGGHIACAASAKGEFAEPARGEQGTSVLLGAQKLVSRGHKTISLSPKHSPWKKTQQKGAQPASSYAKTKNSNSFGQVKLNLRQQQVGQTAKTQRTAATQKQFKSQPGRGEGSRARNAKSLEHVRPSRARGEQQAPAGGTQGQAKANLNAFLDTSLFNGSESRVAGVAGTAIQISNQSQAQHQSGELVEQKQVTLNILAKTQDQLANLGQVKGSGSASNSLANTHKNPMGGQAKSKARPTTSKDISRQLIQTKYLNFQQSAVSNPSKKRGQSAKERVSLHKTGQPRGTQQPREKRGVANPFGRVGSSQGQASASAMSHKAKAVKGYNVVNKNKTVEIELRKRSRSKQGKSMVLSDTPSKEHASQKRARSGGSSNHKGKGLGVSSSFSPKSRQTQFAEARSLLFENQSSGVSVNSKKQQNLNQLLNQRDVQQLSKRLPNAKLASNSQEQITAAQSSSLIQGQAGATVNPSYINLDLQPPHSAQSLLIAQDHSAQQIHAPDGKAAELLAEVLLAHQSDSATRVDRKSKASQPRSSLNASLGKIVRHGDNSRKRGGSQSPKGNKWANKGAARPQTQMGKTTAVISAANTSRIDRIIQENLKKQNKKTMQRKIREQEEEQVTRKKKAELEQVNEKIRNANKEKVQRRKQQTHGLHLQPDVRRIKTKTAGGVVGNVVNNQNDCTDPDACFHNSISDGFVPPQQSETVSSCLATIRPFAKGVKLLRFKNPRKSNGLDFIDIRREINAEMKQFGVKKPSPRGLPRPSKRAHLRFIGKDRSTDLDGIDSSMLLAEHHLRASKSQRQMAGAGPTQKDAAERCAVDFFLHLEENGLVVHNQSATLKTGQGHVSAHLRMKQTIQEKLHTQKPNQSMTNGLHMVLKKEKIRKFMMKKQKQKQEAQERSKQEEIQKTLKVHQNLLNLDKYAKKRLKVVSSGANSGLQSRGTAKPVASVSMGGVLREKSRHTLHAKKNMTLVHDKSEPDRTLASAEPIDPVLTMTPSKMPDDATEPQFNVSAKPHSRTRSSKQFKKGLLRQQHQIDPGMYMHTDSNLAELMSIYKQEERSSSCKRGGRKSSQSRATDIYANRSCSGPLAPQFENSTSAKALRAQLRQQDPSSAQPTPGAATNASRTEQSAVNKSLLSRKSTRHQLKGSKQHNVKNLKIAKKQQNPSKPSSVVQQRKRGKSLSKKHGVQIVAHGSKFNVKLPEASLLSIRKPRNAKLQAAQQHQSAPRSSVHTLESQKDEGFSRRGSRYRLASSLVSSKHMNKDLAAKVIQKEVRKYLKQIGFYHARQIPSPEREPQISLFIERRRASRSKDSKRSKSRSGSKGLRQSPQIAHSDAHSPQKLLMQETTIIAELSGMRQADIFGPDSSSESDAAADKNTRQFVKERSERDHSHERSGKSYLSSRQRSGNKSKVHRSGERDPQTSSKREKGRKSTKLSNLNPAPARFTEPDTYKGPLKHLDPIFQILPIEEEDTKQGDALKVASLMEIKSVQTPPSRENVVLPIEKAKSDQSLSANRISCSEFEFRQLQSSVESKPSSSVDRIVVTAHQQTAAVNDGASQSSSSLFDRNAFQQYSQKKLKVLMQESEHSKLIKFREEILRFKEHKERKHIRALFKQKKCSPRSYQAKQKQIDRWVQVEQQEIEKSKSTFKEEWEKTVQMIEDTQKNVNQMRYKMNLGPSSTGPVLPGSVASVTSTHKPGRGASGGVGGTNTSGSKMLNNFNSQSCNSLSSQPGYQKNTNSNGLVGSNLVLSGAGGEHQRSILMEDPPKSYRSGRQEVIQKVPVLQLGGGICPDQIAEDIAAGSLGVLSSRRSVNGGGTFVGDSGPAAQSLLQYMEQRLASHTEQRQASLGELKRSSVDSVPAEIPIEIQGLGEAQLDAESATKSKASEQEQPCGRDLTKNSEELVRVAQQHSRKQSSNSVPESEVSHQPSAEFLERLEKVNKQEPFISSTISENLLGSGNFTAIDGVLMPAGGKTSIDGAQLQIEENQFAGEAPAEEVKSGGDEDSEKVNFKNQVMTIKDFGLIDSKRTSNQSETSNEKEFNRMLNLAQAKSSHEITPSAENLLEPSLLCKQMEAALDGDKTLAVKSPLSNGDSIRISEMLKMQADLTDLVPGSQQQEALPQDKNEEHSETDSQPLLQEPAIFSSSQTLEVPQGRDAEEADQPQEPVLVPAKTKPAKDLSLGALQAKIEASPAERNKVVDQLTDLLVKQLVEDCTEVPPRAKVAEETGGGQASHDVYYVDQLQSEKEEKKEWIELRQRHLIENDLIRIDQYVNEIVDALLQFEIDLSSDGELLSEVGLRGDKEKDKEKTKADAENYHVQFLKQLTQPIFKRPSEVLQTLQTSEIGSYKHFETTQDLSKHPIIPVDLYLEIEKAREEAMLARKGAAMSKQTQMVWESIHIQNKSFFDAINESLMKFRPYGLTGEPMPWSNKVRRLQTKVDISSVDTERLFQMVKQEVFRWVQAFCGALPSPVFCFPPTAPRPDKEEFNEDLFQENREKRLTQILSAETVEQEHHWLNYEYEEAQVKIDLSDMILEYLVDELVSFLNVKFTSKKVDQQLPASEAASCQVYEVLEDEPDFAPSAGDRAQP